MQSTHRPTGPHDRSIVFSAFRLDRRGGQLTRAGTPIPLRPKTWSVLCYMAERPGELVSREDLLDAIWPDVAVTPDTLTKSIGELRVALGEDARTPRFIETVHRRGFRFIDRTTSAAPFDEDSQTWQDAPQNQPVVGRAAELQRLGESFAQACRGTRQIAFVTGAAGIGKTTLVEAFLESRPIQAAVDPPAIGRGACLNQHGPREAYMPVLDALDRLARRADAGPFVALLRRMAPTWLAQMPWLIGDDAAALDRALQSARPERMLREFANLIEAFARERPLVLVLEDLHWSDPSTIDLLALLGQRREPARLLVIATYRPAEVAVYEQGLRQAVRTLQVQRRCATLPLHDLGESDILGYLEARFPGAALPPALARVLHAHTDGNPLFLNAVIEHMLSRGWILDTDPGWAFAPQPETLDLGIPDDARRMIATQLEGLAPADRALLDAASVAGAEFAAPAVAAALLRPLEEVEQRCEELARVHRFLRPAGSTEWPDGTVALRYAFPHELHRQAVYDALPTGSRQRFHQRIGEAIETTLGNAAHDAAGELAAHFERSGDVQRALRYLAAAAERAVYRLAGREAIGFLETAIGLAQRLPDVAGQYRQELLLRTKLAPLLSDLFGFASAQLGDNCERAVDLAASVGQRREQFTALYALCHVYAIRADAARMPNAVERLTAVAAPLGADAVWLAGSVAMRGATHAGRFADARALAEGPLAKRLACGLSEPPPEYGPEPVSDTTGHYAYALWFLGESARARSIAESLHAASQDPAVPVFTRLTMSVYAPMVEAFCRNPGIAERRSCEMLSLAAEHGFPHFNAMYNALRGWTRVQLGAWEEGRRDIESARDHFTASGARFFTTHTQAFLAEAHWRAGDIRAGLAAIDLGLNTADTTLDRSYLPELWRLRGELLLALPEGAAARAEDSFARALAIARATEARALELRAATSLARYRLAQGQSAQAAEVLGSVCAWFGDATTSPDLSDAREILQQAAAPVSPGRGRRGTPRR
ncbi:MAG: AAA family ATPase [Casimicrobiaceae bacterium]